MGNYWCQYCRIFVPDTKYGKSQHELSLRHKNALSRSLNDVHRANRNQEYEEKKSREVLREVERELGIQPSSTQQSDQRDEKWRQRPKNPRGDQRGIPVNQGYRRKETEKAETKNDTETAETAKTAENTENTANTAPIGQWVPVVNTERTERQTEDSGSSKDVNPTTNPTTGTPIAPAEPAATGFDTTAASVVKIRTIHRGWKKETASMMELKQWEFKESAEDVLDPSEGVFDNLRVEFKKRGNSGVGQKSVKKEIAENDLAQPETEMKVKNKKISFSIKKR